jgi:CRISPR-associated protein Cmr5
MATAQEKPRVTLEQLRAQDAWDRSKECSDAYMKLAKGLPAMIMNSGLMQVVAFLHEKGLDKNGKPNATDHHTLVGDHLRTWLHLRYPAIPSDFEGFMRKLMEAEPRVYQAVTTEAFAWLKWLRQMAAATHRGGK